jgi:hypothetical protein
MSGNHRVLISPSIVGYTDTGGITHPNADIFIKECANAGRLMEYDLVILQYDEFGYLSGNINPYKQVFDKQMLEALEKGVSFCFIHHNETTPGEWREYSDGYSNKEETSRCYRFQAGFRWINDRNIRIGQTNEQIISADVKRGEFNTFLKKWGGSYNYFRPYVNDSVDDIIYERGNFQVGFTIDKFNGTIVYLPLQKNIADSDDHKEAINCLLDSLLTYKAKRLQKIPEWAEEPLFENEKMLVEQKSELLSKLQTVESQIVPFSEVKSLLIASEYKLQTAVFDFVSKHLGIKTERIEKFLEDFWILDEKNAKIVICEVKSIAKGFKKSAIYDVYNHRQSNSLEETFPALLFVNYNLQAGSWAKKDVPIQQADIKIAIDNNVLIVRIEDLVRAWDAIGNNKFTKQELIKAFTTERGWLEFKDGKMQVHS